MTETGNCKHSWTQDREGERGSWCVDCGVKVLELEERQCQDCAHFRKLIDGSICKKHWIGVPPRMHVTYKIAEGSCFEEKAKEPK